MRCYTMSCLGGEIYMIIKNTDDYICKIQNSYWQNFTAKFISKSELLWNSKIHCFLFKKGSGYEIVFEKVDWR
jgi:hypothetical protein